jgi:hypothetical protein
VRVLGDLVVGVDVDADVDVGVGGHNLRVGLRKRIILPKWGIGHIWIS